MTAMASHRHPPIRKFRWPRKPIDPSPIPEAARQTNQIANEVSRVVDQLRRMNDLRERKLQ